MKRTMPGKNQWSDERHHSAPPPRCRLGGHLRLPQRGLRHDGYRLPRHLLSRAGRPSWVAVAELDRATADAQQRCDRGPNVYHGMGLHPAPLGPGTRGTADNVIALPGLFMDLDIADPGAHTETALPESVDDVMRLLAEFPLPPRC